MSLDLLLSRASTNKLAAPAPDAAQLDAILRAALRAPDHGLLRPWRFLVVQGDGFDRLARVAEDRLRASRPGASDEEAKAAGDKMRRAPMAIVIGARIRPDHPKIPEIEQILSVGAAGMNLLNAIHGLGFAAKWVSGPDQYSEGFARALGFNEGERCFGMLLVGTASRPEVPAEHDPAQFARVWG